MHSCPYCRQPGISSLQKLNSVFLVPAACANCGKRSFLHYVHGIHAMVAWVLLTWVFIGLAMFQHLSIYLIGTVPALVFAVDRYLLKAPLDGLE